MSTEDFMTFDRKSGCNGCNRDHPFITLRFDVTTKSTIAHLSHRLDPFVQFMNSLVAEEKAWPQSASEYQINGYLRPNLTLFRQHRGFGGHLITRSNRRSWMHQMLHTVQNWRNRK